MVRKNIVAFTKQLVKWHRAHPRPMPWKDTDDPYLIWISEIILQQTQVAQGTAYYLKFAKKYPTVFHLARASESQILKDWQGLGYNSRARHMRMAAKQIVDQYDGKFPNTREHIRALKGVGEYTAAAIGSFAFGHAEPVLDSNVLRVLSRILGLRTSVAAKETKAIIRDTLSSAIVHADPAEFNQAIMNFGALHCTARKPDCAICPFIKICKAHQLGAVDNIPVKPPPRQRKDRHFHYLVISDKSHILLRHRRSKDIWQGMYDLPLIETRSARAPIAGRREQLIRDVTGMKFISQGSIQKDMQVLTHQRIHCKFYAYKVDSLQVRRCPASYQVVNRNSLSRYAFPKVLQTYIDGSP